MTKQEINKLKEDQIPVVSTTDKGIHFSPRFVGLLADEVARTVVRTLPSFRRQGKGNSKKKKNNKPLDSAVFLDTSAIIDGRVFDVISLGLFRGNVVVLDSILLELKHIADSKDLVRRERGRKGLLLLEKVKKVKGIKLLILSAEKEKNMVADFAEIDEWQVDVGMGSDKFLLIKPLTFMNLSGMAVKKILRFAPQDFLLNKDLIVVHDDASLDFGRIKVDFQASSAGQKGVQNIIDELGTKDFYRVRVGINAPRHSEMAIEDFVLGKFSAEEQDELRSRILLQAAKAVIAIWQVGYESACNEFNSK